MSAAGVVAQCNSWLNDRWTGVYTNPEGALIVPNMGRTACFVEVTDTPDGLTRVDVHAPILLGVAVSPTLYEFIALNGTNWRFGALTLLEEAGMNIEFDYPLLGDGLSGGQLNYFVELVGTTANELIDTLQAQFGGRTAYAPI